MSSVNDAFPECFKAKYFIKPLTKNEWLNRQQSF